MNSDRTVGVLSFLSAVGVPLLFSCPLMKRNGSDDNADRNGKTAITPSIFGSNFYQLILDFLDRTSKRGEPGSTTVRLYFTVDRMRGTIDR